MKLRSISSAGWPSFSYMARKNNGSIKPIIRSAAVVSPIQPRVKIYAGIPMTAATLKQMSCLAVRLKNALFLILLRSFGTLTKAT